MSQYDAGSDLLLLPVGTRLLHVGPPKTATTTLQSAFHTNRAALAAHRVHYAGRARQPMSAALAAAADTIVPGNSEATLKRWPRLLREIDAADADRVMLSSEFFSHADDERARAIVEALGADRTHVIITLRPLVKIIPSQWQQYVRDQLRVSYPDWLDLMFNHADQTEVTPTFWRRHRHDLLVQRWAKAVGPENLTVIVLDARRPERLLNIVEEMLALPLGTLVPKDDANNRSMTLPEVELMRAFNIGFKEQGWTPADYTKHVRFGSTRRFMQRVPPPDEPQFTTPQWAVDRSLELSRHMIEVIAGSGANILGDLEWLTVGPNPGKTGEMPDADDVVVRPDLAARHSLDVLGAAKILSTDPDNLPSQLSDTKSQLAAANQQLAAANQQFAAAKQEVARLRTVEQELRESERSLTDSERLRDEQSIHHHTARDLVSVLAGRARRRLSLGRGADR